MPPFSAATTHATFLTDAGAGTLPPDRLALWLSQDRIYAAHAYPKFIGSLIARIPFSHRHGINSREELKNQEILKLFVFCLENIVREVAFFNATAERWNLKLEGWKNRKGTRDYVAEMVKIADEGLVEGLVFLWAMERVYLDSWSHVQAQLHQNNLATSNSPVVALTENWTSPDFVAFVNDIGVVVDGLGITPSSEKWKRAEEIWARVAELEVNFWPEDGEELTMSHIA
ncbi:hypothetical protein BDQ12DRAFT_729029 [Crucibulum laeve]|uniref:Thiaminase-2/PQQC domain-containing protein n=1 Tax=Crucibulum laeve TaxID=68775 RepID=A0A5C3LTC6_9AGAR|nr:hypothetical protein BDQ12DRAFT_729029 [Crucibulum laeve]